MAAMPADKAKKMQEMLNKVIRPKPPLAIDGDVGPKTRDAIKSLQQKAGLMATGDIDGDTAIVIVRAMKTGQIDKELPTKFIELGGGRFAGLTDREYQQMRARLIKDLQRGPVTQMRALVAAIEVEWDHFNDLINDQWFVGLCVQVSRGVNLPPKSVVSVAQNALKSMEALAAKGDFDGFAKEAPKAARTVNQCHQIMTDFRREMVDGSGHWVTGLEATKWASFTFLSVYAAPVTGAAMGASALATAVVGGAAIKATESAASEIGNWSAGKKDWTPDGAVGRVLVDAAIGVIMGWLTKGAAGGGDVVEAVIAKIATQMSRFAFFKALGAQAGGKFIRWLMTEGAKSVMEGAVDDVRKIARRDPGITFDTLVGNIAANFVKGVPLGALDKVLEPILKGKVLPVDKKTLERIKAQAAGEVAFKIKGTVHLKTLEKDIEALAKKKLEPILGKLIGKVAEKYVVDALMEQAGALVPQKVLDSVTKKICTPALEKAAAAELAEVARKDLKVAA